MPGPQTQSLSTKLFMLTAIQDSLIQIANTCDKAYAEAAGHPEWHQPFGIEQPNKIANNAAAVIGCFTAVETIAYNRGARSSDEFHAMLPHILSQIAQNTLSAEEKWHGMHMANTTWKTSLAYRTQKTQPGFFRELHRLNNFYELAGTPELDYDYVVIQAVATALLAALQEE